MVLLANDEERKSIVKLEKLTKEAEAKIEKKVVPRSIELYAVPKIQRIVIPIEGTSSFISHRKDEKAGELWEKKMTGVGSQKKLTDPEEEWKASLYLNEGGQPCLPGRGIKKAMVSASMYGEKKQKTYLKGAFYVLDELIPIEYEKEIKRRDFLPLMGGRSHHNSYRVEFAGWKADVNIEYNVNAVTPDVLYNLMEIAGFSVGIGDDRPEKNGMHGRFRVAVKGR